MAIDGKAQLTYGMAGPFATVSRSPDVNIWAWRNDMVAIWNLSRMRYFTQDDRYAKKAREILLARATTQTEFSGRESMLDLGDYAHLFVGGADILRGTWSGWTEADTATVRKYFNDVLMPESAPCQMSPIADQPVSRVKQSWKLPAGECPVTAAGVVQAIGWGHTDLAERLILNPAVTPSPPVLAAASAAR